MSALRAMGSVASVREKGQGFGSRGSGAEVTELTEEQVRELAEGKVS